MKVKEESRKSWLKTQHSKNYDQSIPSHHFMAKRWGKSGNRHRFYFLGLQNHLWLLTHNIHFEITLAQGVFLGHKMIDMNLEERQIPKQIYNTLT